MGLNCTNHPEIEANGACVGCGKFFCVECLREIKGKNYCNKCADELFDKLQNKVEKLETTPAAPYIINNNNNNSSSSSSSSSSAASSVVGGGRVRLHNRSKVTAGVLAILLGGLGIQHFYLGKPIFGILSIVFCWAYVPSIIGLIQGIMILCMSDAAFDNKYNY